MACVSSLSWVSPRQGKGICDMDMHWGNTTKGKWSKYPFGGNKAPQNPKKSYDNCYTVSYQVTTVQKLTLQRLEHFKKALFLTI